MHPLRRGRSHALLERGIEGAVATEAALVGQLLDRYGLADGVSLVVETDEMLDAKIVDVGVVCRALTVEILAEVGAVDTNLGGEQRGGNVVLQIELSVLAVLLQLGFNFFTDGE